MSRDRDMENVRRLFEPFARGFKPLVDQMRKSAGAPDGVGLMAHLSAKKNGPNHPDTIKAQQMYERGRRFMRGPQPTTRSSFSGRSPTAPSESSPTTTRMRSNGMPLANPNSGISGLSNERKKKATFGSSGIRK